jgi:hypothetical protein
VSSPSLRERLRPGRADLVDAAFGCALAALGVVGFRTVFAGGEELLVGLPAVVVGAALGYVLVRLRIPLLVSVAVATIVLFLLAGPIALRDRALAGFLPSPEAVSGLADGLVNGWIRLLTTLPPAGRAGELLAIPYLCGFAGGALALALARRYPRRVFCVLPPTVVLVVSVLMGTKRPASLLLQGVVFAALTIAWVSARHHRNRTVDHVAMSRSRLAAAAGLLAVSALSGVVVGPRLPGADPDERYVLREDVEPPFDPLTEPSPLASYRNYTDQDVREDEVLTVRGLPDGARLRIAAMDAYSGTEWEATGSGSVVAGEYLRVGAEIPAEGLGPEATVSVEVHQPEGVWVPLGGDVTGLDFLGPRGDVLDDEVRVSIQTDTAAVPRKLEAGDRYRFTAQFVDLPAQDVLVEAPLDPRFARGEGDEDVPTEFVSRAADWVGNQPTAYAEVLAIAKGLQTDGAYTDGGPDANPVSPPGHSLRRLLDFITIEQPFGNGEQFAAAQGLMAQARGIPVRVVMGFVNEEGGDEVTFHGEDIEAWIEVPVAGYGWVAVDGTPPEDQLPDPMKQPRSKTENPEPQPPPPTTIAPPTSVPEDLEPEEPEEEDEDDGAGGIPGWLVGLGVALAVPAVMLGVPAAGVVLAKRRRRERRRTTGTSSQRVAGSFDELVDLTRDLGRPVPPRATRRELSTVVEAAGAVALATRADDAVFGAADPTDADVDAAWDELASTRATLLDDLDRWGRVRTAVSPTSLRRRR